MVVLQALRRLLLYDVQGHYQVCPKNIIINIIIIINNNNNNNNKGTPTPPQPPTPPQNK